MNMKYEFQLSPGFRSLPQPRPRCACPQTALRIAWIDLGLGSPPCPCPTTQGPRRGPALPPPCSALSSPRAVGRRPPTQVPAHHAHFPARLPSHCCLARASVGQRRQRCVSAAIAASVGTPGTRRLLSGVLPDHGTEKRTLGRRAALRPGSVSVRQDVLRTKEMTSYTFDTERESVLRK